MADKRKAGAELAEDVLGFGGQELVTAKDLLIRPAAVLNAWMAEDYDGAGRYARPLRLYLTLNAILMLILFLCGGAGFMLDGMPPSLMEALLEQSGKSRDAFIADAEGWMTLVMVPLLSVFYALPTLPLIRWWDKADLGWRRGLRASFGWLSAWTVPVIPLSIWSFGAGPGAGIAALVIVLAGIATFVRMGIGRWFASPVMGLIKGIVLMAAVQAAAMIGGVLVIGLGIVGALLTA
jgi:hypothetical protein